MRATIDPIEQEFREYLEESGSDHPVLCGALGGLLGNAIGGAGGGAILTGIVGAFMKAMNK